MAEKTPAPFMSIHRPCFHTEALASMLQLQKDDTFTDVKIKTADRSISCHKLVLSTTCPYFEALFRSKINESHKTEVIIDTIDYKIMNSMIRYLYGQEISVDLHSIQKLIEACDHLQLENLKGQLAMYILDHLTEDNCIGWWKISDKFNLRAVGLKTRQIMMTEIEKVSASDEFKNLSLADLIDYIKSDDIPKLKRDAILMACIEWIDYEPVARKDTVLDVLKHVQLELCSSAYLKTITTKYKDLLSDPNVKSLIYEAVLEKLTENDEVAQKEEPKLVSMVAQKEEPKLVVLGGISSTTGSNVSKCWVSPTGIHNPAWKEFASIPLEALSIHSKVVCLPAGFAVMCGGNDFRKNTLYNAEDKTWSDLPPTPVSMKAMTSLLCNNSIYLLGGQGTGPYLDTVYHLDLTTRIWHTDPKMLIPQIWPMCASKDGNIYVVYNNNCGPKRPIPFQLFNENNKKWRYLTSLPQNSPPAHYAALVFHDKYLYVVGGHHKICARYELGANTWTLLKTPILDHYTGQAIVCNEKVYVCGGGGSADIEEYDIKADRWRVSEQKLPQGLGCFAIATVLFL